LDPRQTTSGDLLADRRHDYAEMLFASGDHAAAAGLMLDALELAPGWALGWFRMGEMHEAAGALDQAAEAWRMAQKLDPDDRAGAALKLELIGRAPISDAPPGAFVEALFDQYAPTFDKALVEKLDYRVPRLLFDVIGRTGQARFAHAVDLGCGTGLMGERLRPLVDKLEGCDISAAMLKKAETKGVYDRLFKADLQSLALPPTGSCMSGRWSATQRWLPTACRAAGCSPSRSKGTMAPRISCSGHHAVIRIRRPMFAGCCRPTALR
jgi:tetratricopeptide (TPR) repeat protein